MERKIRLGSLVFSLQQSVEKIELQSYYFSHVPLAKLMGSSSISPDLFLNTHPVTASSAIFYIFLLISQLNIMQRIYKNSREFFKLMRTNIENIKIGDKNLKLLKKKFLLATC